MSPSIAQLELKGELASAATHGPEDATVARRSAAGEAGGEANANLRAFRIAAGEDSRES